MSVQNYLLKQYLRRYYKPRFDESLTLEAARLELNSVINNYMPSPCRSLAISNASIGGIESEIVTHKARKSKGTFFYIHGGAFAMGSAESHRGITCELAKGHQLKLVVPNYRLAPEHKFPAAIEDLFLCWQSLISDPQTQYPIILGGDQAGACIALQFLLQLKQSSLPMPSAFVGISGLYDLTLSSPSLELFAETDCANRINIFIRGIDYYLSEGIDLGAPTISPMFADLSGLPPMLLQVATNELLRDDSIRLEQAIKQQGGHVCLQQWEDVPSCWHIAASALPEGRAAIKKIGEFIKHHCF